MKLLVYMVFSYTENVITRQNYHLFKSFLIKENKKWHFFYTKTYKETCFFQEFVTKLEISVKMIFLEPGKFENIQELSSTFKNLCKG